jgi:hypothetical protein
MKNFSKYILEKLKIKKSHFKTNLLPKTKEELIEIIKKEMSIFGDDCSLNHIDISNVKDLSYLFCDSDKGFGLGKFCGDISNWDMSGVETCNDMFTLNKSIETIVLPDTLVKIDKAMFWGCMKLTHVDLPDNLETIEDAAFMQSSLEEIHIPSTVKYIGSYAFDSCQRLKNVDLSKNKYIEIRSSVCNQCTALKTFILPQSGEVGGSLATYTTSLKNLTYNGTIEEFNKKIKISSFVKTMSQLKYVECSDGQVNL